MMSDVIGVVGDWNHNDILMDKFCDAVRVMGCAKSEWSPV